MKLNGIFMIIHGVLSLTYQGLRNSSREKRVVLGANTVTTTEKKSTLGDLIFMEVEMKKPIR